MLRSALYRTTSLSRTALRTAPASRFLSIKDDRGFGSREDAIENKYFNKQDKLALEKLLSKLKHHTEPENTHHHANTLEEIFEYHGVALNDALKKDLVAWKTGSSVN